MPYLGENRFSSDVSIATNAWEEIFNTGNTEDRTVLVTGEEVIGGLYMSDDIIMKVLMLKGAKGDRGDTLGKLQMLAGTTTVTTPGTTEFPVPISAYNPQSDILSVYMNGLFLQPVQDYNVDTTENTPKIVLTRTITIPSNGGDVFRCIAYRVVAAS